MVEQRDDGLEELEDGVELTSFTLAPIDTKLLTSPVVLRALGGIITGIVLLAWPDRTDRFVARVLGLSFILLAVVVVRSMARSWPPNVLRIALAAATAAAGVALVTNPDRSTVFIGRLTGLLLLGGALYSIYRVVRSPEPSRGRLALHGLIAAAGFVLILVPEAVFGTAIAVGAIVVVSISLLMLIISLDARTEGEATYGSTAQLLTDWLRDRPKSVEARQALYEKILYEGPATQTRVVRFFTLMGFAAVIASMGVITDSTAVVIGAMLVAPLMTPLMGTAISLAMGWPNRLARSALLAAGGIVFAIAIGALLGLVAPAAIDTTTNTQIVARSSPTILDLITAIAAGAAGAYGLSRPDVSDSLPGVAIAISLVPPLTVVGIAYSQADWVSGNGALLLFATNMVAILLVGGITFILTGVTPIQRMTENQYRVKTALLVTCTAAVLILGALLLNGAVIAANVLEQSTVESTTEDWLNDAPLHRLVNAEIDADTVTAVVIGPSDGLPDVAGLADDLGRKLDRTVTVNVSLVVEERLTATSDDG